MKRLLLITAWWLAAAGMAVAAQTAPAASAAQKPIVKSQTTSVTATVEAIDRASRQLTLKTEDGRSVTGEVGPDVKRFDAIQVGDRVTVSYYETVVFKVAKPGEPPMATGDKEALTLAAGDRPGGSYGQQRNASVMVEDVRRDPPSLTVKGERGRVLTFRIADPTVLDRVKKGDRIDITYTEAFLVKIDPVAAK